MRKILIAVILTLSISMLASGKDNKDKKQAPAAAPAAPATAPAELTITKAETTEIESAMKDIVIFQQQQQLLQAQFTQAQTNLQNSQAAFQAVTETVKKAHGWGTDVVFDGNRRGYVRQAPPAKPSK